MNRFLFSVITGLSLILPVAASAAPMNVLQIEAKTSLSSRWENPENRKLLEERLRLAHTNQQTKEFHVAWFESNKVEIGKYSQQYRCMSGSDVKACRGTVDNKLQR